METEQPPSDIDVSIAILDLMLIRALSADPSVRLHVPTLISVLKQHDYSIRSIARVTGIPRATLGRWNQGATA
jgi:hypothetical protein